MCMVIEDIPIINEIIKQTHILTHILVCKYMFTSPHNNSILFTMILNRDLFYNK